MYASRTLPRNSTHLLLIGAIFAIPAIAQDSQPASMPTTVATTQPADTQPTTAPESQPGPKPLTHEAVYGPEGKADFNGTYARGMEWEADGRHYLYRQHGQWMRIDAVTNESEPAYDADALQSALQAQGDFDEDDAKRLARRPGTWNADRTRALIEHNGQAYLCDIAAGTVKKVTHDDGERRELLLSPQDGFLCFVRENDLYSIDIRKNKQRRLTRDGGDTTFNGILDWVYQEEIYGRGDWRGFWISPDDKYVAYLQLDESPVPVYSIVNQVPMYPPLEQTNYPKSGDPNPGVRLGVVKTTGGRTAWVDLSAYAGTDILVMRVSWSPDGKLVFSVQDREQRWMDLCEADPKTGKSHRLLREDSPAWVNDIAHPHWLADGSFLWLSERDGYRHIYHYARDGKLIARVTDGDWEVRGLFGVDEKAGVVYFRGTKDSVLQLHAYRVSLAGGSVERLTQPGFSHRVDFDPTFTYFFDTFSNASTPTRVNLCRADGSLERAISENDVPALREYVFCEPEFVPVTTRDGYQIWGMLIRPPDFDPSKKYPVWCSVYGGPGSQTVWDSWQAHGMMDAQLLAQQGTLVWNIDPRSGCGRGALGSWQAYKRLGQMEVADFEDGVRWLIENASADPERVGITGHSYGGYMTAYTLTHSTMFSMGIAGAPVTDWHNYDTIYTERFMQTPEHNPDGYKAGSVVEAAGNLHGKLLVAHGLIDDNVHFQNTAQLLRALQAEGKQFDLMVYPLDRHGIWNGRDHYRELREDYIREHL